MKLSTLNYIHNLLIRDLADKRAAMNAAHDAKYEAKRCSGDSKEAYEKYSASCDAYNMANGEFAMVVQVLEDFEKQSW